VLGVLWLYYRAHTCGERAQALLNAPVHGSIREAPVEPARTRRHPSQQLDPLTDRRDRPDMELAGPHCVHDIRTQHQVLRIAARDQHTLRARQAARLTNLKEPLDLLIDPAMA
jgi:hypothetical protein